MKSKRKKSTDRIQDDRKANEANNGPDTNQEQDRLPGDYPPQEDIMNRLNSKRVGIDVENFSRTIGTESMNIDEPVVTDPNEMSDDSFIPPDDIEDRTDQRAMEHPIPKNLPNDTDSSEKNESDVTEEDLQALGPKDLSMDMGEDEQLRNRVWPVDMAGADLDVPGAELDDASEAIGNEDEENNSYSLGGDRHEDNLEGK